jgi:hypothetical protein
MFRISQIKFAKVIYRLRPRQSTSTPDAGLSRIWLVREFGGIWRTFLTGGGIVIHLVTKIINLSLSTGVFSDQFKSCSVHTHLKSLTWTKKICQIIVPFLTCLSCLNSLKELLNFVSLITCLITVCSILFSLLTSNVTLLTPRLLFYLFMTTSLRL